MPKIKFSNKQLELLRRPFVDNSLEVLEGTPRSGKTTGGVFRAAEFYTVSKDENHLVLGYNQEQAFKLFIDCDGFGLKNIFAGRSRVSHDEHGDHLAITIPDGNGGECVKRIYYKGGGKSDSYKAFQGLSFGSVVFLEIDLLHPNTWHEAFRRTFAARKRWHLADLNPPAPQHPVIKDVFDVQNTLWQHWTMDDNPILTAERKQAIFDILSKNPYLLKRDYYGERCIPQGVIYSMFNHDKNIVEKIPDDEQAVEMFFAGDGGLTDATSVSCNIIARKAKQDGFVYRLYRMANYYYNSADTGIVKAMSTQAKEIAYTFMPWCRNKFKMRESVVKIDPACKALREELRLCGVDSDGADNNAHDIKGNSKGIKVGIEYLQSAMEQGLYNLVETDEYGHYDHLRELSLYVVDKNGEPVDMYNHSLDEARYANNYFYKQYVL